MDGILRHLTQDFNNIINCLTALQADGPAKYFKKNDTFVLLRCANQWFNFIANSI